MVQAPLALLIWDCEDLTSVTPGQDSKFTLEKESTHLGITFSSITDFFEVFEGLLKSLHFAPHVKTADYPCNPHFSHAQVRAFRSSPTTSRNC